MGRGRRAVYVETLIRADIEDLWEWTQRPVAHQRWDLRFQEILYASPTTGGTRRFRYSVHPLPGLVIDGHGSTIGERRRPDGTRTSALRFASEHRLALIRAGSGYWRYIPGDAGVRFVTGYDYRPGWGQLGPAADLLFRPLLGWATAWSFDRLRLWLETGQSPERSLRRALLELGARIMAPGVLLIGHAPLVLAGTVAAAMILLPPLPRTPAARRCLRNRSPGQAGRAPATLPRLEPPCPRSSSVPSAGTSAASTLSCGAGSESP